MLKKASIYLSVLILLIGILTSLLDELVWLWMAGFFEQAVDSYYDMLKSRVNGEEAEKGNGEGADT